MCRPKATPTTPRSVDPIFGPVFFVWWWGWGRELRIHVALPVRPIQIPKPKRAKHEHRCCSCNSLGEPRLRVVLVGASARRGPSPCLYSAPATFVGQCTASRAFCVRHPPTTPPGTHGGGLRRPRWPPIHRVSDVMRGARGRRWPAARTSVSSASAAKDLLSKIDPTTTTTTTRHPRAPTRVRQRPASKPKAQQEDVSLRRRRRVRFCRDGWVDGRTDQVLACAIT